MSGAINRNFSSDTIKKIEELSNVNPNFADSRWQKNIILKQIQQIMCLFRWANDISVRLSHFIYI